MYIVKCIFIVKVMLFGDVVEMLFVVVDLYCVFFGVLVDWVVDELCVEIVCWYLGVSIVLCVLLCCFKKMCNVGDLKVILVLIGVLCVYCYDVVIDLYGVYKSVIIVVLVCVGCCVGYWILDFGEIGVCFVYLYCFGLKFVCDVWYGMCISVGEVFGYVFEGIVLYGIELFDVMLLFVVIEGVLFMLLFYVMLNFDKKWLIGYWVELVIWMMVCGLCVLLLWGLLFEYCDV